ncbi:Putative uncharacterized protein {ECO:0000313/EMBL:BAK12312.1} [Pantoea ananatis]|nr:Putative uncharacterized protein {ECO:0000313/EMBL:BAK12312.1} [Pantoea ananatis]
MTKMKIAIAGLLLISGSAISAVGSCDVIGGGAQYQDRLTPDNVAHYVTVRTFDALKQAVDSNHPFIYVPGDVTITVPNQPQALRIKAGQTLFSNRGEKGSRGALLQTPWLNDGLNQYPVYVVEAKARITGLRIEGPSGQPDTPNKTIGIQFLPGTDHIDIDNNEIYHWPWAGISVKTSVDNKIHHNVIHDNIRTQLGYGVVVQNGHAQADIYCNTFNANRHAIAGKGDDGEGYHAYNNLVLNGGARGAYHQFDMHKGAQGHGGKNIIINNNLFDYGRYETSNRGSVYIRGVPTDGPVGVNDNLFTQPWTVGLQTAVGGVPGSIPPVEEIKRYNRFSVAAHYSKDAAGFCVVSVAEHRMPVNCESVASVLEK